MHYLGGCQYVLKGLFIEVSLLSLRFGSIIKRAEKFVWNHCAPHQQATGNLSELV